MSNEQDILRDAERRAREKFQWSGRRQPRERTPIVDVLPNVSDDFNPDLCVRCHGAGWMVDRSERNYGALVRCESCDRAMAATIARCWKVSSMSASTPNPPQLKTFEPYSTEAAEVLRAMGAFIREPFGWLTLYGSSGTGKSHALEAMARYFLTTNVPAVFITSMHLWEYLGGVARGEHETADYAERFRWMSELPALLVDELNVEKSTEFVFKTRRSLFDARYRAALDGRGVTVLASNEPPAQWQDAAVADRALDTRFVAVYTGSVSYRRVKRG